jgi:hypothetical protein
LPTYDSHQPRVMLWFCVFRTWFRIAHGMSFILHIVQKPSCNSYPCNKSQLCVYMAKDFINRASNLQIKSNIMVAQSLCLLLSSSNKGTCL